MKNLMRSFFIKALAVFLFTALLLGAMAFFAAAAAGQMYLRDGLNYAWDWVLSIGASASGFIGALIAGGVVCVVLAIALFLFLLCAAGWREGAEQPVPSRLDRVPFDLLLTLSAGAYALLFAILQYVGYYDESLMLVPVGFLLAAGILVALMLCVTFAARIKTGTFWRTNILAYLLLFAIRIGRATGLGIAFAARNIALLWKVALAYILFGLSCMLLYDNIRWHSTLLSFLLLTMGMLALLCILALQVQRLQKGARALAAGDLAHRVEMHGLYGDIKEHARALNGIGDGMLRAVEERMKSERMKTDLIANVSHDLKTPLTSIINYVDLLQKQDLQNETAREYVEVLARQAQRLKRLATDIVEASKASSGAVQVELTPTDLREIVHQSLAEYAQKLAGAQLTPVVRIEDAPHIFADGRLSWRVLDNLLNNACKYALPGTRLYCEAEVLDTGVSLTMKNISREPLGLPAEELTERFVRGDTARASEGSGLGLSIAKSLMQLQNGELQLHADGDLFKATLLFAKAE